MYLGESGEFFFLFHYEISWLKLFSLLKRTYESLMKDFRFTNL